MNIIEYLTPLKKWWWLLGVATVLAAISSYVYSLSQPPVYQVRTTLMVGNTLNAPNPSGGEFYLQQLLAGIYADIAYREPVRQATMQALGLDFLPEYTVRALPNSTLIEIVVNDTDPVRTTVVANELAKQLMNRSPSLDGNSDQDREFLQNQLQIVRTQIEETRKELENLQTQLSNLTSARQISEVQGQIQFLENRLNNLQSTYAALLSNTQQGATNALTVIEPAELPTRPIGPNRMAGIILAAGLGLVLAAGAAYLIEFLDDTVKTPEEAKRLVSYPVLGEIVEFPQGANTWTYALEEPRAPVTNSFRVLRNNLDLLQKDYPIRSLLVSSAGKSEGKSVVVTNLAIVMAQRDRKIICVDADFHRPVMHQAIQYDNHEGLSDVLLGRKCLQEVIHPWIGENLMLIPSGELPEDTADLLGSRKMEEIIETLTQMADMVIFDGPPFFLADASILSTKVDGLLLVIRPGYTRKDALKAVKEQITQLNLPRVWVALNRVPKKESYYSKYYPYENKKKT